MNVLLKGCCGTYNVDYISTIASVMTFELFINPEPKIFLISLIAVVCYITHGPYYVYI